MKLEMVGLLHAQGMLPSALSGGMRKRAAIARAIALDPEIVFFDEPSAGLDPLTAAEVDNLICKLNQVFGITMVVVTHDLTSATASSCCGTARWRRSASATRSGTARIRASATSSSGAWPRAPVAASASRP